MTIFQFHLVAATIVFLIMVFGGIGHLMNYRGKGDPDGVTLLEILTVSAVSAFFWPMLLLFCLAVKLKK